MGFRPSPFLSRNSKNATSHARGRFLLRNFFKGKTNMNNKLEASLSQNDLNSLFSTKVEKVDNNHFYIRTKTHQIRIKNPKITWEKPYTEPKQTKIELVDTTETFIGATSPSRTELFFHGVASIENFPDLALFDSVILDSPIIEPIELLKNKQFSYNLDYHLYDFGTGQDIDLYDDEKSLSQKEWNAMFEQGVPTGNPWKRQLLRILLKLVAPLRQSLSWRYMVY